WEVKRFYPNEYVVGEKIRKFLNKQLNINLPEEESGNIAFHIVNARMQDFNIKKNFVYGKFIKRYMWDYSVFLWEANK
ncbi:Transcriptional antiterminator, partial [Candidatus Arthromitus sp. SFB-3]